MKIFKDNFTKDIEYDKYFNGQAVCFLDIETTGFSRRYNMIYLIGLVFFNFEKRQWELIQIFADDKESEKKVLLQLIEYIKDFDRIITYNGDAFDIPFINSRLKLYNIEMNLFSIENFDLYRIIRENRYILQYENYKLKTIEESLGIYRDDIYSGGECIQFYKDYLKTRDENPLAKILQHNYDDLYYLVDIMKILDIIDDRKSVNTSKGKILIDGIDISGDIFSISGYFYSSESIRLIHYENYYKIDIDKDKFKLEIDYSIGMVSPEEKGLFLDKSKFALNHIPSINANYDIPDRFLLLQVEKNIFMENIKSITSHIVEMSINNLM